MTSQQAKEILFLYRPGTEERSEPEFAEALAQVEREPELARWFEQHRQLQETLRARFRQIPVPEGLKEQIISERRSYTAPPPERRARLRLVVLAVASALLLVSGTALWMRPGEDKTFAGFQHRMSALVLREYPAMELRTNDLDEIHQFLAQTNRGDYVLPAGLAKTTGTGCAVLRWQDKPVAMICFNSGASPNASEPDLFLFIIASSDVPGAPPAGPTRFEQVNHFTTATWSSRDKTYLLGTLLDEQELRKRL